MERIKHIRDTFITLVEAQLDELDKICTKEMGEVIDMIKDCEEAMYYHAMRESEGKEKGLDCCMREVAEMIKKLPADGKHKAQQDLINLANKIDN